MKTSELKQELKLIFVPTEANNFRPKFFESRVLLWCLLILFILKILTVPFLICFPKSVLFGDVSKAILIELLNKDRQAAGLAALTENAMLDNAALMKAQDMLSKDYFSHQSPTGVTPWYWFGQAGYNYKVAGENLAIGFLDSEEVNHAWLDSPSHRANLLNSNYKEVGIAILRGDFQGNETTVVVQLFGAPKQTASGLKVETKEQVEQKEKAAATAENPEKETAGTSTNTSTPASNLKSLVSEVKPAVKQAKDKAAFNLFSFLSYDYQKIMQIIIYGFLGLIILALLVNIFVRIDIQHVDLILKTLGFITVLILFILIDKGVIIRLIPHNFSIF